MTLNKQAGNMYPWCDYTWNPIRGKCPHECGYCYMKKFKVGELRLDEKSLNDDLGKGNTIFVGSSTDMFADAVPTEWISRVLSRCNFRIGNTYLFQTKNPSRFFDFLESFPSGVILGTTIETNRESPSTAPDAMSRMIAMSAEPLKGFTKFVSIEPVMDFDLPILSSWMYRIRPKFISIGADSKGNNLTEPDAEKLKLFIGEMQKLTEVKVKTNLGRIMNKGAEIKKDVVLRGD